MARGRKTPLPPDQIEYLESVYPEWLEKWPHLRSFWAEVEQGWFAKWPVEPKLGLPIASTSIEESELSEADQKRIGDAEEVMRGVIHNWINNRGQKEKKAIATNNPTAATSVPLRDLFVALGGKTTQIKQRTELWTRRNREELRDALEEEDYASLMGVSDDEETPEERKERIKQGQSRQMTLKRAVTQRLYDESPEEEKAAVEQTYLAQERKTKKSGKKAETPEEFQMGLDQLGSVLKQFHTAATEMTGLVGGTVLVGPIPKEGGKIGTQSYCHGATAAGHTLDQAHPRCSEQVVNPLQQFGKKVFDHKTRRERALQLPETSEEVVPAGGRPDGETVAEETVPRRRRTNSRRTKRRYISTATSGDTTGSPNLNTDDLISFNNPGPGNYLHDMNGDSDSAPPLEDASSDADMSMIDPVLRGLSLPASEDAGNEEPRPLESLGTPPFELRSMSADSPSHKDLAPLTQGFRFGEGGERTTLMGSSPVGGRIPGRPYPLFRLAQQAAGSGTTDTSTSAPGPHVVPLCPPAAPASSSVTGRVPGQPYSLFHPLFRLAQYAAGSGTAGPPAMPSRPPAALASSSPSVRDTFAAPAMPTGPSRLPAAPASGEAPASSSPSAQGTLAAPATPTGPSRLPAGPASGEAPASSSPSAQGTLASPATPTGPSRPPAAPASGSPSARGALAAPATPTGPSRLPAAPALSSLSPSVTAGIRPYPGFDDTSVWANGTAHEFHHGTASCVLLDTERLPAFPPNVKRAADAKTSGFKRTQRTYAWGDERAWGTGRAMGDGTSAHKNTIAPVSHERMKEIRAFEKECDARAARAAKQQDHGIFAFGPPPAGHKRSLPHGPAALGARRIAPEPALLRAPSARERRAPVCVPVHVVQLGKENATGGDGGRAQNKTGDEGKGKRKTQAVDVEVDGRSKKKRKTG
ncbi:hypothetical protein DFH08DRAFT_973277 [Mycena albidolilacea]|uniref:Uncharacterized protein n=1 Tax=Mycena albidolilacea TaxID=1033008 RepID=A0AAD6Z9Y0_9AGAR|nr:hypothetical protein DFH08DRAFT_973277 [Mycena albidolilacea]